MTDYTNRNADRVLVAIDIAKQLHDALILWLCMANYQSRGDQGTKVAFRNKIG